MARARYQVLVIPYCIQDGNVQFCLFRRSDMGFWQFIAGGGEEDDISIIESAKEKPLKKPGFLRHVIFSSSTLAAAYRPTALRMQKQYGVKNISSFRSTHLQ